MKCMNCVTLPLILLSLGGCLSTADEPTAESQQGGISALEDQLSGTASASITFNNNTPDTAFSDSVSFAGSVQGHQFLPVNGFGHDFYTEQGIGNVTSFHINYTAGSKSCHFDDAAVTNPGTLILCSTGSMSQCATPCSGGLCTTPVTCKFTNNAQSKGSVFANCTTTLTSFDTQTCSQTVTFSIQ